ncbi:unnamed protein product [Boreogadus saida]
MCRDAARGDPRRRQGPTTVIRRTHGTPNARGVERVVLTQKRTPPRGRDGTPHLPATTIWPRRARSPPAQRPPRPANGHTQPSSPRRDHQCPPPPPPPHPGDANTETVQARPRRHLVMTAEE